jgi:membrane-associated protease RseP (regulator of RpoE activity)
MFRSTRSHARHTILALGLLAAALPVAAAAEAPKPSSPSSPEARAHRARVGPPLLAHGKRGFLGVDLVDITPELRRHYQAGEDVGVLVSRVEDNSPAAQAGVEVGDVLVAIDGKAVDSAWDLRRLVAPRKAGEAISLEVIRDGGHRTLQATLVEREGRVVDIGPWMQRPDGDHMTLIVPDAKEWAEWGEQMGKWGEELGAEVARSFDDPAVKLRIEQKMRDRDQLQRRIDELERRLRDLEKRLQSQQRR